MSKRVFLAANSRTILSFLSVLACMGFFSMVPLSAAHAGQDGVAGNETYDILNKRNARDCLKEEFMIEQVVMMLEEGKSLKDQFSMRMLRDKFAPIAADLEKLGPDKVKEKAAAQRDKCLAEQTSSNSSIEDQPNVKACGDYAALMDKILDGLNHNRSTDQILRDTKNIKITQPDPLMGGIKDPEIYVVEQMVSTFQEDGYEGAQSYGGQMIRSCYASLMQK